LPFRPSSDVSSTAIQRQVGPSPPRRSTIRWIITIPLDGRRRRGASWPFCVWPRHGDGPGQLPFLTESSSVSNQVTALSFVALMHARRTSQLMTAHCTTTHSRVLCTEDVFVVGLMSERHAAARGAGARAGRLQTNNPAVVLLVLRDFGARFLLY